MPIQPGSRLGAYEVVSALGAGGMGEVFRAHDTRLRRDVAIKVLPASLTHDRERLARLRREAELLAALNHPNIAAVYGLEESYESLAIVMELVGGGTLADRLATQGRLSIDEAVGIARQVADALEAAHEKGIIHRDLKPGNNAFTSDGHVKVLDFGLAKAVGGTTTSAAIDPGDSPTLTSPAMTQLGLIIGTAAYMSPEQAKGRPADKRSDIWAFGCVLFEMLTGTRPFTGDDVSDTLAAVLRGEPEWSALPPGLPPQIRALVERCLQKDRRKRIGDISTAIFLIDEQVFGQVATAPDTRPGRHGGRGWLWPAVAALALFVAAGAVYVATRPADTAREVWRFHVTAPPDARLATPGGALLSPDGRHIVFVITTGSGQAPRLAIRSFDAIDARPLAGTEEAANPFWSPDSRHVAFFARGRLKKVDLVGSPVQDLCAAMAGTGGTWAGDGTILFAPNATGGLFKVSQAGGTPVPVTSVDTSKQERSHRWPWFLPDGNHYLFVAQGPPTIYVGSLDAPDRVELVKPSAAGISRAVYSEGHVLYLQDGTLMALPFDPSTLQKTGEPVPVTRNVTFNPSTGSAVLSASTTGLLSYRTGVPTEQSQLVWVDRTGKPLGTVGSGTDQMNLVLSPDGQKAAVSVLDPARNTRDIAIYDLARDGQRARFTFDPADEFLAVWTRDGSRVIFSSSREPDQQLDLYQRASSGAGADELVFDDPSNNIYPTDWSPGGHFLVYHNGNANSPTGNDIFALPMNPGAGTPVPLVQTTFNETGGKVSPNGRWLAYQSNESGRLEVFVVPFAPAAEAPAAAVAPSASAGKWMVSRDGGLLPRWRGDGQELFYLSPDDQVVAVEVRGDGPAFEFGQPRALFKVQIRTTGWVGYGLGGNIDVAADGQRFLVNTVTEAVTPHPITVVVNWVASLGK